MKHTVTTTKNGNLLLTFQSHINVDNGYTNTSQGTHISTMELFLFSDSNKRNGSASIEWYIESLDTCTSIGVWWEHGKLVEYDGVFELPKEVKYLLNKYGVRVPKSFYE